MRYALAFVVGIMCGRLWAAGEADVAIRLALLLVPAYLGLAEWDRCTKDGAA